MHKVTPPMLLYTPIPHLYHPYTSLLETKQAQIQKFPTMSVLNTPTPSPPNHFSRVQGKRKERGITDIYKRAKRVVVPRDDYSDVRCKLCRSGDKEEEILLCDGCDDGFHVMCLRPVVLRVPEGSWFCDACSDQHSTTPKSMCQFHYICNMYICLVCVILYNLLNKMKYMGKIYAYMLYMV